MSPRTCRPSLTPGSRRRAAAAWLGPLLLAVSSVLPADPLLAEVLWSDIPPRVIHSTPEGNDILGGALHRDDTSSDVLYFRLKVEPLSDVYTERYYALFQLVEDGQYRLAVGNAPEAWGYSACFTSETGPHNQESGEYDLKSAQPEAAGLGATQPYELARHNQQRTIVFKVQYVPGADDLVTVWLSPERARGATDENQPEELTTRFQADASFDEIRLRHEGGGNGWIFSDMAIATSFNDFVVVHFWQTWWFGLTNALGVLAGVILAVRLVEKRKYLRRLQVAERERAVEAERARIAQDLHDELGSSLARISLLSNLVKLDRDHPSEVEAHASKLAQSADDTVRALEEIVWAVRPGSDSLQGLMDYIAHFADEFSNDAGVRCRLDLPHDLPERPLAPDIRHNIFLIVKEALTNAIKHAGASEVSVRAKVNAAELELSVHDNGQGFDPSAPRADERNGLRNMRRRTEAMKASLDISSQPNQGTTIRLRMMLAENRPPN